MPRLQISTLTLLAIAASASVALGQSSGASSEYNPEVVLECTVIAPSVHASVSVVRTFVPIETVGRASVTFFDTLLVDSKPVAQVERHTEATSETYSGRGVSLTLTNRRVQAMHDRNDTLVIRTDGRLIVETNRGESLTEVACTRIESDN